MDQGKAQGAAFIRLAPDDAIITDALSRPNTWPSLRLPRQNPFNVNFGDLGQDFLSYGYSFVESFFFHYRICLTIYDTKVDNKSSSSLKFNSTKERGHPRCAVDNPIFARELKVQRQEFKSLKTSSRNVRGYCGRKEGGHRAFCLFRR